MKAMVIIMKILVLNCGSSSIKYKLFEMEDKSVLAQGGVEKIGLKDSFLKFTLPNGEKVQWNKEMEEKEERKKQEKAEKAKESALAKAEARKTENKEE